MSVREDIVNEAWEEIKGLGISKWFNKSKLDYWYINDGVDTVEKMVSRATHENIMNQALTIIKSKGITAFDIVEISNWYYYEGEITVSLLVARAEEEAITRRLKTRAGTMTQIVMVGLGIFLLYALGKKK